MLSSSSNRNQEIPPEERASSFVRRESVPRDLRTAVAAEPGQHFQYTTVFYEDGPPQPGLAVGALLDVKAAGTYELYYLFPLTQEQETLSLVGNTLAGGGVVLVLLIGAVAWLVTRQVVHPVRAAARTAERLSAGRLQERMQVRGEDDLARLQRRSTPWQRICSGISGSWRICPGCSVASCPTCRTSCARR